MNLLHRNQPNSRPATTVSSAAFAAVLLLWFAGPVAAGLEGHGGSVHDIAVAPDGKTALTAGFDYSIIHWDLAREQPLGRLMGHDGGVNAVAFVPPPSGAPTQAISAADDGAVILWDIASKQVLHRFAGHKMKAVSLDVSPDGKWAASAAWDRTVRIWDLESRTPGPVLEGRANRVNAAVFAGGGKFVVTASDDGSVRIWNRATGDLIESVRAHDFVANALSVSNDGTRLATASVDKTIRLWSLPDMTELALIELHDSSVLGLDISPDGALLASSGADGVISLWSIPDGQSEGTLKGHDGAVWALKFSPSGDQLLSAGRDETVRIWDIAARTEINPVIDPGTPAPETMANMTESEQRGQWHFRKCRVCHSVTAESENRAGPTLYGIVDRMAGTVADYDYSAALVGKDIVWNPESLSALFGEGPENFTPGSKMPLQRLQKSEDRIDLVNYMKRITAARDGVPLPGKRTNAIEE